MEQELICRYRVIYSKKGMLRFCGHLDLQRLWERALRRASLPIRYSQGFSPKARLNLAAALPLGYISSCEILDFWMNETCNESEIANILQKTLPMDVSISSVFQVPNDLPSLQSSALSSDFVVKFPVDLDPEWINQKMKTLKNSESLMRSKRGKTYDLISLIETIELTQIDGQPALSLRMSARPGATGRPDEVLEAIEIDPNCCLIERTCLHFSDQAMK